MRNNCHSCPFCVSLACTMICSKTSHVAKLICYLFCKILQKYNYFVHMLVMEFRTRKCRCTSHWFVGFVSTITGFGLFGWLLGTFTTRIGVHAMIYGVVVLVVVCMGATGAKSDTSPATHVGERLVNLKKVIWFECAYSIAHILECLSLQVHRRESAIHRCAWLVSPSCFQECW